MRNAMQNQIVKRIMHWKDILEYYFTHFSGNTYPFIMFFFFLFCLLKLTHRLPSKLILFYLHIYIITYMYVLSVYIWQYCYASFHSLEHSNDVMYVCIEPMETKSDKRLDCLLFFNRILRHMHLRLVHTCHTSLSLKNFHNKKKLRHLITKCVEK